MGKKYEEARALAAFLIRQMLILGVIAFSHYCLALVGC